MLELLLSSQFSMLSTSAAQLRTVLLTWCHVFPVNISCGSVLHVAQDSVLAFYPSVVCVEVNPGRIEMARSSLR